MISASVFIISSSLPLKIIIIRIAQDLKHKLSSDKFCFFLSRKICWCVTCKIICTYDRDTNQKRQRSCNFFKSWVKLVKPRNKSSLPRAEKQSWMIRWPWQCNVSKDDNDINIQQSCQIGKPVSMVLAVQDLLKPRSEELHLVIHDQKLWLYFG